MCIQQQTAMLFVQVFEHLIIVCKVTNDDYSIGVWFIVFNLLLQDRKSTRLNSSHL